MLLLKLPFEATLMSALVEAARRHGASLSTARFDGIELRDGSVIVGTSEDVFGSDAVVIAAGSWSGLIPITPAVPPPVRPVRGQLLHLLICHPAPDTRRLGQRRLPGAVGRRKRPGWCNG